MKIAAAMILFSLLSACHMTKDVQNINLKNTNTVYIKVGDAELTNVFNIKRPSKIIFIPPNDTVFVDEKGNVSEQYVLENSSDKIFKNFKVMFKIYIKNMQSQKTIDSLLINTYKVSVNVYG